MQVCSKMACDRHMANRVSRFSCCVFVSVCQISRLHISKSERGTQLPGSTERCALCGTFVMLRKVSVFILWDEGDNWQQDLSDLRFGLHLESNSSSHELRENKNNAPWCRHCHRELSDVCLAPGYCRRPQAQAFEHAPDGGCAFVRECIYGKIT